MSEIASAKAPGVAGNKNAVAFFDLDKTIIAKAAMPAFRGPLRKGGLLSRRNLWRTAFAQLFYLHLSMSEKASARMRSSALKLIKGWERVRVVEIVDEALERIIDPLIYAEAVDLIDQHHAEGRRVVIVSASPDEIVTPLGRYLGADESIASTAVLDEQGRYTGEIAFYAYGAAKAEAIRRYCADGNYDILASYAYSDSRTDLPMLESVGHPVVVNPDRDLERLARERGWEVRHFLRPIRLRDRVHLGPPRPAVAFSASAAFLGASAAATGWWLGRRRHGDDVGSDAAVYAASRTTKLLSSLECAARRRLRVLRGLRE